MNRDDIIRMVRESGDIFTDKHGKEEFAFDSCGIERFANLVAAAERERIKWDTIHSCHPECDKPVCVAIRKAVAEEREACAKVCEALDDGTYAGGDQPYGLHYARAIRERGAPTLERLNKAAEDNGEPL